MKKDITNNAILIIIILMYILWPIKDFGLSSIVYEGIFAVFTLIYMFLIKSKITITKNNKYYFWIAIVLLIMFLLPNSSPNTITTRPIIINFCLMSLFISTAKTNDISIEKFKKLVIIFSYIYSIFTILTVLFPNLYINWLLPYLKGVNKIKAIDYIKNGYGPMIDDNASYLTHFYSLGLCTAFSNFYFLSKNKKKSIISLILISLGMLFYGRRSEILSIIITLMIMFLVLSNKKMKDKVIQIFQLLLVIVFMILIYVYFSNKGFFTRFAKTFDIINNFNSVDIGYADINNLSSNRLYLWKLALNNFYEHSIIGIGWGKFRYYYGLNTHNTYLQFLCEGGLIGFLLLLIPLLAIYLRTIRLLRIAKYSNCNSYIKLSLSISFGLQTFLLILNFFDPSFYRTYYTFLLAISVILTDYAYYRIKFRSTNE